MAAGVAHEINNPAAVILGNLEVLATELGEGARPVAREIELITQQVERIRHIVTSLLQFARATPAERPVEDADVNLVVRDVLPLVTHVLKQKSVRLSTRLEARRSVGVNAFDLEQVLINLIVNAIEALKDRPDPRIILSATENIQGKVTLKVADNGAGIAPELLDKIFIPFFSTRKSGSGIGLSLCKQIMMLHKGNIHVQSNLGEGTAFYLHF
jgi:two-component system NtrC family sensor kinase